MVPNGVGPYRIKIAENFNRLSRVHERYRRTTSDRRTDDSIYSVATLPCKICGFLLTESGYCQFLRHSVHDNDDDDDDNHMVDLARRPPSPRTFFPLPNSSLLPIPHIRPSAFPFPYQLQLLTYPLLPPFLFLPLPCLT